MRSAAFRPDDERVLLEYFRYMPSDWSGCRVFHLIEALATRYREKAGPVHLPVPADIITHFGVSPPVEVRLVPLRAYRGAVWRLEDAWVIHLNRDEPPESQRVTLFHEVFHILAHAKSTPVFKKTGSHEGFFNEMLATTFANCLLMPRECVEEKWGESNDIGEIAEIFGVTRRGAGARLRRMGLI